MSHSTSSARSDLKVFTSPMAAYNFRMRAICDVSDIRTFLRLMLNQCPGTTHVYKKNLTVYFFSVQKSAQLCDCLRCTVATANRPSRRLECSLDILGIRRQHAQTGTGVDDDGTEAFVEFLCNRLFHPAKGRSFHFMSTCHR